jgi:hypothetical protein
MEACLSEEGCVRPIIAIIGDSFAMGQGHQETETRFTEQLERLLWKHEGLHATVLNFGRLGVGTKAQISKILPIVAKIRPDIIVIAYLTNDIAIQDVSPELLNCFRLSPMEKHLIRINPTLNYLYFQLYGPVAFRHCGELFFDSLISEYQTPHRFRRHQEEIGALVRRSKSITDEVLFAIIPFPTMWIDKTELRDSIYSEVLEAATREGAKSLSMTDIEDEHSLQWYAVNVMDPHPGEEAHLAIAESLLPTVARAIRRKTDSGVLLGNVNRRAAGRTGELQTAP